jgi:sulfoxide reductase heme-binding subunit YedZ|tara:strand:+ start:124 stop:564 length:441 start_codon:yes stop_codon:yes gene_type:complete
MKKSLLLVSAFSLLSTVTSAQSVSLRDVPALITSTYIFAVIFLVVFLLLAIVISNMISFEGGANPKDAGKRRRWFWIFAILGPISFYLYNFLMVIPTIRRGPAMDSFSMHPAIATGVILVSYILIGFIIAKTKKRGKLGNWFPSKN